MSLFKKTEPAVDTQPPREILQEKIDAVTMELHEFKENAQKQIEEICSALNILDEDVVDLKEDLKNIGKKKYVSAEIEEIKETLDSLKLMGRLSIQNKEELEVLREEMNAHHKPRKSHSHLKIFN